MVCLSFLTATSPVGSTRLYVARLTRSPFCVVSAVALSSFLRFVEWRQNIRNLAFISGIENSSRLQSPPLDVLVESACAVCAFRFSLFKRRRRLNFLSQSLSYLGRPNNGAFNVVFFVSVRRRLRARIQTTIVFNARANLQMRADARRTPCASTTISVLHNRRSNRRLLGLLIAKIPPEH